MLENYFDILINSLNKRTETKIYSNPIRQKKHYQLGQGIQEWTK